MSTWLWVLIIVVVLVLVFGVMRRRRGVCHRVSPPPCLDCSPTHAGQTLRWPGPHRRSGSLWPRRVGDACRRPRLVWCWPIRLRLGWLA